MGRVLAIVGLRLRLALRAVRATSGVLNLASAVLLGLLGIVVALGLAVSFGVMTRTFLRDGTEQSLATGFSIAFYTCGFFAFFLPLLRGAMDQGFDAAPFRVFPIGRLRLYLITLGAAFGGSEHLLYLPTLAAVTLTGVVLPGVNVSTGLVLVLLALVFYVSWSHALMLFLVSVMRARRAREILAIVGLGLLIGASLVPLGLQSLGGGVEDVGTTVSGLVTSLLRAGRYLPPSLVASGLTALHREGSGPLAATSSILWLLAWNGTGLLLGYRIFSAYHLGDRLSASRRKRRDRGGRRTSRLAPVLTFDRGPFASLPPVVRAVASKDLRYLLRSVAGRFALFMAPVLAILVMLVGETLKRPVLGIDPERVLLFGLLFYAVMLSNNFLFNSLAWEGDGIRSYYLSPVPLRGVLAGKNLAVWLYDAALLGLILLAWSVVRGIPDLPTLLTGVLLFASATLLFTCCGNLVSVLYPTPRNISSMGNTPSQVAMLLSILALALTVVVIGPFLSIPLLLGWVWLQPVLLAGLLGGLAGVYVLTLDMAAGLLERRKERVIDSLKVPI